jgi:hypothetical protein
MLVCVDDVIEQLEFRRYLFVKLVLLPGKLLKRNRVPQPVSSIVRHPLLMRVRNSLLIALIPFAGNQYSVILNWVDESTE